MADTEDQDHHDEATPGGSRRGKVKNNFNRVARDLDRALGLAQLSGLEHLIMQEAREQSYTMATLKGSEDPLPIVFDRVKIRRISKRNETHISYALASLQHMQILVPIDPAAPPQGRAYRINKNYGEWVYPPPKPGAKAPRKGHKTGPLLDADQIQYCDEARGLGRSALSYEKSEVHTINPERLSRKIVCGKSPSLPFIAPAGAPGIQSNTENSIPPQPPEAGGIVRAGAPPANPGGAPVLTEVEADVFRMVLKANRDESVAQNVVTQFRARVAEGYSPADVHSSYFAASQEPANRTRPGKWTQWVATNLQSRKVRGEIKAEAIRAGEKAAGVPVVASPTPGMSASPFPRDESVRARLLAGYGDLPR